EYRDFQRRERSIAETAALSRAREARRPVGVSSRPEYQRPEFVPIVLLHVPGTEPHVPGNWDVVGRIFQRHRTLRAGASRESFGHGGYISYSWREPDPRAW